MGRPTKAKRKRNQPKPGRNQPCACGSGVKFKRCCGALPKPTLQATNETPTVEAILAAQKAIYDATKPDERNWIGCGEHGITVSNWTDGRTQGCKTCNALLDALLPRIENWGGVAPEEMAFHTPDGDE